MAGAVQSWLHGSDPRGNGVSHDRVHPLGCEAAPPTGASVEAKRLDTPPLGVYYGRSCTPGSLEGTRCRSSAGGRVKSASSDVGPRAATDVREQRWLRTAHPLEGRVGGGVGEGGAGGYTSAGVNPRNVHLWRCSFLSVCTSGGVNIFDSTPLEV